MEAERAARAVEEADARAIAAAEAASMRQVGQHPVSGRCEGDPDHLAEIILSAHAPHCYPHTPHCYPCPRLLIGHPSLVLYSFYSTHPYSTPPYSTHITTGLT